VETGLMRNRKLQKHDRLELEDISFHEKVRKGFLGMAAREQDRIRLVDCSGDIEAVQRNIVGIVDAFFDALQK
ncbi:MAG TPA: hypothetical protein VLD55_06190, partial [Candidatus Sulfobium mesophilum]|nr:hypothetical protein [Candidatus Sulfobium mesophilum]